MNTIADRYEIGEVIGTGGMSDVYEAEDLLLGRTVALKMLKVDLARDVNFRERFRREAQNSGRLNHPAIVSVYDTGEDQREGVSVPFIVMERVFGHTLRDIVRDNGPFPPAEAAETLLPVCQALQASHDAGIIHRDIKPANIMITNTGAVKVMDFGIARALDDHTSAMTQTAAVIGTAQYLSPEQARGKTADARSDVYSLGCVLYEALTGHPPFEGETPFAVAYQHVQEEPEAPSHFIPNLTPTVAVNVDSVVLTAMAKHPADRYQSAEELGEDLELLARGAVTHAARSHVAVAGEGAAESTTTLEPVEEPAPPKPGARHRPKQEKKKRSRWPVWLAVILAVIALAGVGVVGYRAWQAASDAAREQETVAVPDLVGLDRSEAVRKLREAGFQDEIEERPDPEVPEDEVLATNPEAGSQLQRGTTVTLVVSSGKEQTEVPDLSGLTIQEAQEALAEAGLELAEPVRDEPSADVPKGQIIEQNPTAGIQLPKGSEVRVTRSAGPDTTRIPDVTGLQLHEAEATLTSLGFEVAVDRVDSTHPEGEVLELSQPGEEVISGSTITVRVSNGNLMVMPDLSGLTKQEAVDALKSEGWHGESGDIEEREPRPTSSSSADGTIAAASPAAGDEVDKSVHVEITLYEKRSSSTSSSSRSNADGHTALRDALQR